MGRQQQSAEAACDNPRTQSYALSDRRHFAVSQWFVALLFVLPCFFPIKSSNKITNSGIAATGVKVYCWPLDSQDDALSFGGDVCTGDLVSAFFLEPSCFSSRSQTARFVCPSGCRRRLHRRLASTSRVEIIKPLVPMRCSLSSAATRPRAPTVSWRTSSSK